jgi:Ca-activated chloride channel homolog
MATPGYDPPIIVCSFRLNFAVPLLFLLILVLCPLAYPQSMDPVHVLPPPARKAADSRAGALAEGELSAFSKPLRVDVDLVLVSVIVADGENRPVTALGKHDFSVYENNKEQQIRYFSNEDGPISVGVIMDLSGTMSNKIDTAREAMVEFFNNANSQDDYFVITFSDRPELTADTTQSLGNIQASLAMVKPAGYTALLDAVYLGLKKLHSARYQRRALLIISDGGENNSRYTLREMKDIVAESGVEIYAIGIFDDSFPLVGSIEEQLGKRVLTQLTDAAGGRTIPVEQVSTVPQIAAIISRELRNQYLLGYRPSNVVRDGKWRKIRVRVTPGTNTLRVQPFYRRGYMAPAD